MLQLQHKRTNCLPDKLSDVCMHMRPRQVFESLHTGDLPRKRMRIMPARPISVVKQPPLNELLGLVFAWEVQWLWRR